MRAAPTPAGRAVAAGAVVAWALAWSTGYRELGVVAAAGLVALAVAALWAGARPRQDIERSVVPERVVRGDLAEARLRLSNPSHRPTAAARAVDQLGPSAVEVELPGLAPGASETLSYAVPTSRRGVYPVGPLTVQRDDPLGLMRSTRSFGEGDMLWVYPRTHPISALPSGRRRDLEGPTSDAAAGSITFHALREYVTGDDLRLVHWRSTARTGTLMVRQQADPSRPQCSLVLDVDEASYPDPDAFEAAVEAAASIVMASTAHRFPVGLRTTAGLEVTGHGSRATAQTFLDRLAAVELERGAPLGPVLADPALGRDANTLVVLTGAPAADDLLSVRALHRRIDLVTVVQIDAGTPPGRSLQDGVLTLVAPDGIAFAELWDRAGR